MSYKFAQLGIGAPYHVYKSIFFFNFWPNLPTTNSVKIEEIEILGLPNMSCGYSRRVSLDACFTANKDLELNVTTELRKLPKTTPISQVLEILALEQFSNVFSALR